ncbi:hypothetical protein JD844_016692 [Phrynosoma platyrhinos]|uniref:Synaptonemal complex protein 2 armadillo-repeat-like domain-containing protein n=1 Tax=Phrynosoma platyrhinos TaxID=52577 RepID=A0ABQ7SKS5_PHRPL|nr:hypothetical protein JD844_016692 [Phrynosoma platyrhinos]
MTMGTIDLQFSHNLLPLDMMSGNKEIKSKHLEGYLSLVSTVCDKDQPEIQDEEVFILLSLYVFYFYMVTWFERTREFLSLIEPKENNFLVNLIEDFFDTALIISRSNSEGRKQLLDSFLPYLGHLATEPNVSCALRQETVRTLNTLLDNVPQEERKKFSVSEEMCLLSKEFAKTILDVGDYDIQVAVLEAIFRVMLKKWRDDLVHHWFEDQHIAKAFKEIKHRDFETDCRKFLNELNERLGDKRRVCSIPCKAAHADMNEGALWESVRLPKEDVSSFYLQAKLPDYLTRLLQNIEDSAPPRGQKLFRMAAGSDVIMDKDDNHKSEDQPQHNPTVVNSHLERTEDIVGTDSLSDILTSQPSEQSHTTQKTSHLAGAMAARENQQAAEEHVSQASSDASAVSVTCLTNTPNPPLLNASALKAFPVKQKDKTVEPSVEGEPVIQYGEAVPLEDGKLEKTNRARSSSKQISDVQKDAYEFENFSDPAAHEMVSGMKQKVFVQKSIVHRMKLTFIFTFLKSATYKSHLFSESNQETPSNSTSEKSWILSSQKKSTPKISDYTRKRPRVRSTLKVLPLSSPSSDSGHHAKRKNQGDCKYLDLIGLDYNEEEVLNVPVVAASFYGLEMVDATLPLSSHSSSDYSDAGGSKKYEAATTALLRKDKVSKAKRKLPGQHLDKSEYDVFVSKILEEEAGVSGVIAAFEKFVSELNKMFWFRHKTVENYTQNILTAPEQMLSTLLKQIHQSWQNELENFCKILLQEFVRLNKRTQFLMSLEKDTMEFWTEQTKKLISKLSAFDIHQMQRMESMDSLLDEPKRNLDSKVQNVKLPKGGNDKEL